MNSRPGRLRRLINDKVDRGLRPATRFQPLRLQLSEWYAQGDSTSGRSTTQTRSNAAIKIEVELNRYFREAEAIGKRWGMFVGLMLGLAAWALVAVVTIILVGVF